MAALAGVGLLAAGCADNRQLSDDMRASDFGHAVKEDMAAQIADPDAVYRGAPPPSSGDRAALAQTRYKTDKVTPPVGLSSGNSVGGGGGGSSGGGGGGGGGGSPGS
jgi:hypothetical protein